MPATAVIWNTETPAVTIGTVQTLALILLVALALLVPLTAEVVEIAARRSR